MTHYLISIHTITQAADVISRIKASNVVGEPIVMLCANLHKRLSDPENMNAVMQILSKAEGHAFEKVAGPLAFSFTLHNPTGHYILDLGKNSERDVATHLAAWKNQESVFEEQLQKEKSQVGFAKINFERVWRNASINGHNHIYSTTSALPCSGKFEIDFVQISKPDTGAKPITDSELDNLLHDQWSIKNSEDPEILVKYFRELSNTFYFTCKQVQDLLILVTKASFLGKVYSDLKILQQWATSTVSKFFNHWRFENRSPKRFVRLVCLGNDCSDLSLCKLRVEIMVIAFARTIDWHGIQPLILEHLSQMENDDLEKRLGRYNLFDKVVAVGAYNLDLSSRENLRVMQVWYRICIMKTIMLRDRAFAPSLDLNL